MSALTSNYYKIVSQLPADAIVTFHDLAWDEYEQLLNQIGEDPGLRISYDSGT